MMTFASNSLVIAKRRSLGYTGSIVAMAPPAFQTVAIVQTDHRLFLMKLGTTVCWA